MLTPMPMMPRMIAFQSLPSMTASLASSPVLAARPTAPPTTSADRPYFAILSPGHVLRVALALDEGVAAEQLLHDGQRGVQLLRIDHQVRAHHALAAEDPGVVVDDRVALALALDAPLEVVGLTVVERGRVPADDRDRRPATLLARLVGRLVSFPDRLEDVVAVQLLLLGVLHVADVLELEQHEDVEVLVGEDAQLGAAGRVVHQLEQLLRAARARVRKALGNLDLGVAADPDLGGPLRPLDRLELLLRFGRLRLGGGGLAAAGAAAAGAAASSDDDESTDPDERLTR